MNNLILQTNRLLCESDEEHHINITQVNEYIKSMWIKHGESLVTDAIGKENPNREIDMDDLISNFILASSPSITKYIQKNFGDEDGDGFVILVSGKFAGERFDIADYNDMSEYIYKFLQPQIDSDIENGRTDLSVAMKK